MKEIILIAPPRVLGELRKQLSAKARTKVTGEIDKDLSRHPIPEIEKALAREFKESTRRRTRALPDADLPAAGAGRPSGFRSTRRGAINFVGPVAQGAPVHGVVVASFGEDAS